MLRKSREDEKRVRNTMIYEERKSGKPIAELSGKFGLSAPRIHRIIVQEENKVLKNENSRLHEKIGTLKTQLNSLYGKRDSSHE